MKRSSEDRAKTEIRRERYERALRDRRPSGSVEGDSVEQRIAELRARREAAQKIGLNNRK